MAAMRAAYAGPECVDDPDWEEYDRVRLCIAAAGTG
jgi:hypothetical protein